MTKALRNLFVEVVWPQNLIPHQVPLLPIHLHIIRGLIAERILLDRFVHALPRGFSERVLLAWMLATGAFKPSFCGRIKDRPVEPEAFGFVEGIPQRFCTRCL